MGVFPSGFESLLRHQRRLDNRVRSLLPVGAGPFYERLGFTRAGVIPDYALTPYGRLSGTIIYWKRIGAA